MVASLCFHVYTAELLREASLSRLQPDNRSLLVNIDCLSIWREIMIKSGK